MSTYYHQVELYGMEQLVKTVQELSLTRNIDTITQIVKTVARDITNADGATFILREGDMSYYIDEDAIRPLWKGCRFPLDTCISGWVMREKKTLMIEDIYADNRIPKDVYKETFVKSMSMVPIRTVDPIGAIGIYWAQQHIPTEEEVAFLQALADITAVSIENLEVRNNLENILEERTKMLNTIKEQKTQLEEFTQIIAHNLRAPLSNLMMLSDMMDNSKNTEEMLMYIDKQRPVIQSLHEIFEELVQATQVRMDHFVGRDYVNLEERAKKTVDILQVEVMNSNAAITWDFSKLRSVNYPTKYIDSILYNLLSNAIKYRSTHRIPEIHLQSYLQNNWVYLQITDNGKGIDLNKHGNDLFKLRKTFHNNPNAKGFGLFITKTQVEAMGGEIDVRSTPEKGSTFIIKLSENK